jgi:hypothetical protein
MATIPELIIDIAEIGKNPYLKPFLNRHILHLNFIFGATTERKHRFINRNVSSRNLILLAVYTYRRCYRFYFSVKAFLLYL